MNNKNTCPSHRDTDKDTDTDAHTNVRIHVRTPGHTDLHAHALIGVRTHFYIYSSRPKQNQDVSPL